jgi:hypothetical protein
MSLLHLHENAKLADALQTPLMDLPQRIGELTATELVQAAIRLSYSVSLLLL